MPILRKYIAALLSLLLALPPVAYGQTNAISNPEAIYREVAKRLNNIEPALDYLNDQIDHSIFDPIALREKLNGDVDAAFAFVRDEIGFRAYRGALKDPTGVLIDRTGNALDRSLLLAELIARPTIETRIVEVELDAEESLRLAARTFEPNRIAPPVLKLTPEILAVAHDATGLEFDEFARGLKNRISQIGSKAPIIEPAIDATLYELIDARGQRAGSGKFATLVSELANEVKQHFILQYRTDGAEWVSLDSSFSDSAPGQISGSVLSSFATDAMPSELVANITIRLIATVLKNGVTTELELIEQQFAAWDVARQPLLVSNDPFRVNPLKNAGDAAADQVFVAKLSRGETELAKQYYDLTGTLLDGPPAAVSPQAGGLNALANAMKQLDNTEEEKGVNSSVIGLRLEIESDGPQYPQPDLQIRHIAKGFETVSWSTQNGAVREPILRSPENALVALTFSTTALVLPHGIDPQYRMLMSLQATLKPLKTVLPEIGLALSVTGPEKLDYYRTYTPWKLFDLATTAWSSQLDQETTGIAIFSERPTILATELKFVKDAGGTFLREVMDVVSLGHRAVADTRQDLTRASEALLRLGVVWTTFETRLGLENTALFGQDELQRSMVTSLDAMRHAGSKPIYFNSDTALAIEDLAAPDYVKDELAERIHRGSEIIFVGSGNYATSSAWWEIDTYGTIIGRIPGRYGGDMAETPLVTFNKLLTDVFSAQKYGWIVKMFYSTINGLICYSFAHTPQAQINCGVVAGVGMVSGGLMGAFPKVDKIIGILATLVEVPHTIYTKVVSDKHSKLRDRDTDNLIKRLEKKLKEKAKKEMQAKPEYKARMLELKKIRSKLSNKMLAPEERKALRQQERIILDDRKALDNFKRYRELEREANRLKGLLRNKYAENFRIP